MMTAGAAALLCTAAAPTSAPGALASPTLNVTPAGAILDAPFDVTLKGVPPGARVAIRATRRTKDGAPWTTVGVDQANAAGFVDAARFPSLGGSYRGVSRHGLLCSALPVEPEKLDAYIAGFANNPRQPTSFPDELVGRTPIEVTASVDGKVVASATAWRSYAEGTAGEDVAVADGWKGVFFPPATGVRTGAPVFLLAGSGGGLFRYTAARLASCGHPTLAMAMLLRQLPRAGSRFEGVSLADAPAQVLTSTADWLSYHPAPPLYVGFVQFKNGARVLMEMVDVGKEGVETGQKLRMVYRIKEKDRARGYNRYFWKSTPVAAG